MSAEQVRASVESIRRLLTEDAIWIDAALADDIRAHLQDIEGACGCEETEAAQ